MINKNTLHRLHANESPFNLPLSIRKEIASRMADISYNSYPTSNSRGIKRVVGKYYNLDPSNLIIGNGSDNIIRNVIFSLDADSTIGTLDMDFSLYSYYAKVKNIPILYLVGYPSYLTVESIIDFIRDNKLDLFIFSNPNNPTGAIFNKSEVISILESIDDTLVLIDEAYMDFSDQSMINDYSKYDNLVITRTLSKAYSLAGVRIGFGVSNTKYIEYLEKVSPPYTVSSMAQVVAESVLVGENRDLLDANISLIMEYRDYLYDQLVSLNIPRLTVFKSYGNFIYIETPDYNSLFNVFSDNGIFIRKFDDYNGLRFTASIPSVSDKVVKIIKDFYK